MFFLILILFFNIFFITNSNASDSLSYSGRLVQTNGSPVAGPVDLLVDLSYTSAPTTILCSQSFTGVALSNGVFHLKLDLNCGTNGTLADVLTLVPANESAAIRVTDVTHAKAYSFQAMHSMPFAHIAATAKQLSQLGATNNQVLKWNDTTKKWEPGSIAGAGTVTSVSGTLPISVASGSSAPVVSIAQANTTTDGYLSSADWNTFNGKQGPIAAGTTAQYYRGDKTWQTLDTSAVPENVANLYFTNARALGVPLTGFATGTGAIASTDTALQAFGKAQGQINSLVTAGSNYLIKNSTDSITGVVNVGTIGALNLTYTPTNLTDATNKSYVDNQISSSIALKINKAGDTMSGALALDNTLKIKGGANYVTINGNAATSAYNLILPPSAGAAGNVLQTDGSGNLSWVAPATTAAPSGAAGGDLSGTYPNPTVNNLPESRITNLTTDLASKVSSTLANGNILVGNGSNVATAVAVSGDATLANTGALTLKNTGTAGTYSSVTTDAQGRVISGSNPTVVTAVSVTAPITNSGTASVPLIGMPAATSAVDGYLKASDWIIFNNKQAAITATSTISTGSMTTNLQGGVVVNPYGTTPGNTGEIRLQELAANGANYIALKAPDALASNVTYTLPVADGSNGQVLTTNSAGGLSWTTVATGGTTLTGDVGGTISANSIGAGKVTLTHLSATGTKNGSTYLRGDNTFSSLQTDVQALVLSAYTLGTNAVVAATDTVASAFGKLQAEISALSTSAVGGDLTGNLPNPSIAKLQGGTLSIAAPATKNVLKYNGTAWGNSMIAASDLSATGTTDATTYLAGDNTWKSFNTNVIAAPLTGLSATGITKATGTLAATDSITAAFNKLLFTQGDYVSKSADQTINGTLAINSVTGFITVPTPVGVNDAVNKGYVDGFGQWIKGSGANAADIYFNTGKVGIGTTAPSNALQVSDLSGAQTNIQIESATVAASTAASSLRLKSTGGEGWMTFGGSSYSSWGGANSLNIINNSNGPITFDNYVTGVPTERMRISNSGNVGIGTTSPQSSLHLKVGAGSFNGALIENNSSTGTTPRLMLVDTSLGAVTSAPSWGIDNDADIFRVWRQSNISTGGSSFLNITNNGNVGIGTGAPGSPLDITSAGTFTPNGVALGHVMLGNITYGGSWIATGMCSTNSQNGSPACFGANGGSWFWGLQTSPTAMATMMSLNSVGNLNVVGCVSYNGGTAGTCLSDRRLKTDIRAFDLGLSEVLRVDPVYYKYNGLGGTQKDDRDRLGVIAQEVEKIAPQLVETRKAKLYPDDEKETEFKAVNYNAFTYMTINSIKQLYHKWFDDSASLHREIASLKTELCTDRKIDSIKAVVDAKTAKLEAENAKLKARANIAEKENAEIKARLEKIERTLHSK